MVDFTQFKTLENFCRRHFRNVAPNGDWCNFSCPVAPYTPEHKFNVDHSPSAGATVAKDGTFCWHCFTCKGVGPLTNMLTYLQKKSGVSYESAISQLQAGQYIPEYEQLHLARERFAPIPLDFPSLFEPTKNYPDAEKYLAKRGISEYTVRKLGIEFDPDKKRIVFPVKGLDGRLYGFTGRAIEDNVKPKVHNYCDVDKSQFILGIEHWNHELPSILVEGLFALAHFVELAKGKYFPYNIGAIMGSAMSDGQVEILVSFGNPVYVFLDNDPAGKAGMYGKAPHQDWSRTKREMERAKGMVHKLKDDLPILIPKWPEGINDPDELSFDQLYDMILTSKIAF